MAADPRVTLIRQSDGQTVGQNDDWNGATGDVAAAFTRAGAFPLTGGSRDAALVAELAPGAYTVRIQNATTATGIVLAELYQLP